MANKKSSSKKASSPKGDAKVKKVWEKGKKIPGKDPNVVRKDALGNEIRKSAYGTEKKDGWEKDHKFPKAKGGTNELSNLQPLQWKENRKKADKFPYQKPAKKSVSKPTKKPVKKKRN